MDKRRINTRLIVSTGLLVAVEVILQLLSSIIPTGVNLNLALVPITIGAVLYGPWVGGFLGLVCGAIILASPNTVSLFMSISPIGTVLACLLKTTVAGIAAGYVYKVFKDKNDFVGVIVASIVVPFVNTLIFLIVTFLFFMEGLAPYGITDIWSVLTILVGFNFIFEVITNGIISPTTYKVLKQYFDKK